MSAKNTTGVNQSLKLLIPRGGEIGPHADGWGIAFYEGRAARIFKEPLPAAESRCLSFISEYDFRSKLCIGHIRKANPPEIGRESSNTHPFERELDGRSWVFAHNGKIPQVKQDSRFTLQRFHPTGETDSEHAFCYLLDHLAKNAPPSSTEYAINFTESLRKPLKEFSSLGEFNMLLSDGIYLYAFATTNLYYLQRKCIEDECNQTVVLLATAPLTEEPWIKLKTKRVYTFLNGKEELNQ